MSKTPSIGSFNMAISHEINMSEEDIIRWWIDQYRGAFSKKWGQMWYADVIRPLVKSIIENEKFESKYELKLLIKNDHNFKPTFYPMIIESQIGLILVISQTYISQVISMIRNIHVDFSKFFKADFSEYPEKKNDLISEFNPLVGGYSFTNIEAINALANYFKHHEEWGSNITKLRGNNKKTADIVQQMGGNLSMALWSSRNLTNCIKKLGVSSFDNLYIIPEIVDSWKLEIGNQYRDFFDNEILTITVKK